jgi:hypothetical protein
MDIVTAPAIPQRVRKRRRRRHRRRFRRRILGVILLLLIGAIGFAIWTAVPAARAAQDARVQVRALQAQKGTLHHVPTAAELTLMDGHIQHLERDLRAVESAWGLWKGPALFVSQLVPSLHRQLGQVDALVALGIQATHAGDRLLRTLTPIVRQSGTSIDASTTASLVSRLAGVRPTLQSLASQFSAADALRQQIDEADLPSSLQSGMHLIDTYLPAAPAAMHALSALPAALGVDGPRTYLLVPQNNEDLRATGGFIGTVVLLRADHGHIRLVNTEDSTQVDTGYRPNVIPPLPMALHGWGGWFFRDANWSADFPTSAQLLALFYTLGTHVRVDGVVAFTPAVLRTVFAITGPVMIPGSNVLLTANNAFQIIDAQVNAQQGVDKTFAIAAYKAIFDRFVAGPHTINSVVLSALRESVRAHDLQIFAYDRDVENAIHDTHADGAINATTTDYIYVTDTNLSTNKVNRLVQESISYNAQVQMDRTILATVRIQYINDADDQNVPVRSGSGYEDFVRLFVPEGSTLVATTGFDQQWPTYTVHHKTQFSGYFALPSHQTHTITFQYKIPAAVDPPAANAYTLYVQRQPGTSAIPFDATVSGMWVTNGRAALQTVLARDVTFSTPLLGGLGPTKSPAPPQPEPLLVPGSYPEPWVSVPTALIPLTEPPVQVFR